MSENNDSKCGECGAESWSENGLFGNLCCDGCGWMPPKQRRDELMEMNKL